ncbi:MAG: hypothetical protein OEU32_12005, partial [Acidimicrobiia bacterium]|nr:hypothetical protein [Acidimicrobiia bacterium]
MKTVALTLLWIAGSAAAIGVAWAGVNVVDDEVIDPAPAVSAPTSTFETAAGRLPESPTPGVASAPDDEIIDADPETGQEPLRPEAAPEPAPTSEPGATPTPSQQPAGTNEPATTPEPQPQATV